MNRTRMNRTALTCAMTVVATLTVVGFVRPAHAETQRAVFDRANRSAAASDARGAIDSYRTLVESGVDDADVAHNIATTYASAGRYGAAIVWYEHALRLRPNDDEILAALNATRTLLGQRRARISGEAVVDVERGLLEGAARTFSTNVLSASAVALSWLFFVLLATLLFVRRDTRIGSLRPEVIRLTLSLSAILTGMLFGLVLIGLGIHAEWIGRGRDAIVVTENAQVRAGPDPRARVVGAGHEGDHAWVVGRYNEFVRVDLARGARGWMHEADVPLVDKPSFPPL